MLANMLRKITRTGSKKAKKRLERSRGLRMEQLEGRTLLSATHFVDDDLADCPQADFTSIQAAVLAASPGDKIQVCEGVYNEQVTIDDTKDNLELRSKKPLAAVIEAPPGMTEPAIVHVDGANDVTIRGFTIRGPFVPLPPLATGVFVGGGGSATIVANHITAIRAEPLNGVQTGLGILVGRGSTGEVGSALIVRNRIDDYQKNGITVDGLGSSAEIFKNEVEGAGPTGVIAQNGIQISRGADALVRHNHISDNVYTGAGFVATGMLLFEPGETVVTHNTVTENQVGIFAFDAENMVLAHNDVSHNGIYGLWLFDSHENVVSHNKTNSNGEHGIIVEDSDDNEIEHNQSRDNGGDGLHVTGNSSGNQIRHNKMLGNDGFDCFDDTVGAGTAGTANLWIKNIGNSENRPGLC